MVKKKISEWLQQATDSHLIQDSIKLGASFHEKTGQRADWPEHSVKQTVAAIKARGLGGTLKVKGDERLCYGYEVAEHLADKYGDGKIVPKFGRGSRFREALESIKRKGN